MVCSFGSTIRRPRYSQTQYGGENIWWCSKKQAIYQHDRRLPDSRVDFGKAKGVHHCRDERSHSASCGLGGLNKSQHPHLVVGYREFERLGERHVVFVRGAGTRIELQPVHGDSLFFA